MFTLHHVGIIVTNLEAAMNDYSVNLGYKFFQFEINEKNARLSSATPSFKLRFAVGELGLSLIELIQPVSGETLYSQHAAAKGPGLHHLAYSVADLAAARIQLKKLGYDCLQNGSIEGLVDFSYYDARKLGCIIEPLGLRCDFAAFLLQNAQPYPQ